MYDQSIFYFIPFAIAAYYFIVPLFYGRIKNYKTIFLEKLIIPYDDWNWRDYVPAFIKDTKLEKQLLFSIVILILLPQLSFFIGHYLASNQTDYLLFNHEERTHIVLTTTNDSLIVAPFNAEELTFEQEYTIVPYNAYQRLCIRLILSPYHPELSLRANKKPLTRVSGFLRLS